MKGDSPPAAILHELEKFRQMGSALYIAAHPDDENTELLAYLSRGRDYRTAYLSLTRGDGGQNVLGPDLREKLGVARTQELLAARQIDGAQQFFSRAVDFGFSKSYTETLNVWNKQEVLSDIVRVIREFHPDVLITRFSPSPGGTHGHHTASAVLAMEAFKLAGDPKAFPEQGLAPWQPKRIFWNISKFQSDKAVGIDALAIDAGGKDPVSGETFFDIAGKSRAMHKTQGFDTFRMPGTSGTARPESFHLLDGATATKDILEGVDTTWNRVPGGGEIGKSADEIIAHFDPRDVGASVPALLQLRKQLATLAKSEANDPVIKEKQAQLDRILQACLGLTVETTIAKSDVVPGETMTLHHSAIIQATPPASISAKSPADTPAKLSADVPAKLSESIHAEISTSIPTKPSADAPAKLSESIHSELSTNISAKLSTESPTTRSADVPSKLSSDIPSRLSVEIPAKHAPSIPVRWIAVRYPTIKKEESKGIDLHANELSAWDSVETLPITTPLAQPYWLRAEGTPGMFHVEEANLIGTAENSPSFPIEDIFEVAGQQLVISDQPVQVTTNSQGTQIRRRLDVIPPVSLRFDPDVALLTPGTSKPVQVEISAARDNSNGTLQLEAPADWKVVPPKQPFHLAKSGQHIQLKFTITAPAKSATAKIIASAEINGVRYHSQSEEINYPHIPPQLLQAPAALRAMSVELVTRGHTVGYLPGAGDSLPENMQQMGYDVKILDEAKLTAAQLRGVDAIVIGVRAFNVRNNISQAMPLLFDYIKDGGTVIAQYNRPDKLKVDKIAPYDLHISAERVTDEKAAVTFLAPESPVLNTPNKITSADFDGWLQERGLYFANQWDDHFKPILAFSDPDEAPLKGGLLVAQYGKGHFIYTGLAFFRQLPAGVPGAYRLLANLISIGK
jgi:LmbE family N-acetylglucosaminyl deacetylase